MSKSSQAFRTIREVADWLDVAAHVLRFWESKFPQIKPVKRAGGRRYYRPADMELVGGIKVLLHDRGMTIRGVQKMIREEGVAGIMALSPPVDLEDEEIVDGVDAPEAEIDMMPEAEAEEAAGLPEETAEDAADDTADPAEAPEDPAADDVVAAPMDSPEAAPPQPVPAPPSAPKLSLVPPFTPDRAPAECRQQASLFDFDIDNEEPDDDLIDATSPDGTDVPDADGTVPEDSESMPAVTSAPDPAPAPEAAAIDPAAKDDDADPVETDPAPMSDLLHRLHAASARDAAGLMALRPALAALCDRMCADPRD